MSEPATARTARTHPANVLHLVFGVLYLGIAAAWALTAADLVDANAEWTFPLVLVVAGAAGLVASVAKGLGHSATEPTEHTNQADSP